LDSRFSSAPALHLSDPDLRELDEAALAELAPEQAQALLGKAWADLQAAREKLAQNSRNSSRPPSTRAPWEQTEAQEQHETPVASAAREHETQAQAEPGAQCEEKPSRSAPANKAAKKAAARPGRRKGAPGHSRTQALPIDAERSTPRTAVRDAGAPWGRTPTRIGPTTPATCWIWCLPPAAAVAW
jgi:hypothetical protein